MLSFDFHEYRSLCCCLVGHLLLNAFKKIPRLGDIQHATLNYVLRVQFTSQKTFGQPWLGNQLVHRPSGRSRSICCPQGRTDADAFPPWSRTQVSRSIFFRPTKTLLQKSRFRLLMYPPGTPDRSWRSRVHLAHSRSIRFCNVWHCYLWLDHFHLLQVMQ